MFKAIYCENGHYVEAEDEAPARMAPWMAARNSGWEMNLLQNKGPDAQFCPTCGRPATNKCSRCQSPIMVDSTRPSYCRKCGSSFAWTDAALAATAELVQEEEQLSEQDKLTLTSSLPELICDSPRTTLAATRVRRIAGKVGGAFKAAMYKFAVDCASETAKKIVLGE